MKIKDELALALQGREKPKSRRTRQSSKELEKRIGKEIKANRAYAKKTRKWNFGTYATAT